MSAHLVSSLAHQSWTADLKLLLALAGLWLVYIAYKLASDPLRHIPGPTWARFSRLWLVKQLADGQMHKTQLELHEKHGPVVRLAPNHYSFNDLDAAKQIYAHGEKFVKSDFYEAFGKPQPGHAGIFNEQDPKLHAVKRRKVANMYSLSALLSYEGFIDQNNDVLLAKLSDMAAEKKSFPATNWMQYYAFDVIGAITVGEPFGFLKNGWDFQGVIKEIHAQASYGIRLGTYWGSLHRYAVRIAPYIGLSIPRIETEKYIVKNIKQKRARVEEGETTEDLTGRQDFLEKMFDLQEKGKLEELDITNAIGANINAGSDTTAVTLSAIIYFLLRHPAVMDKLRTEIKDAKEAGNISSPITFKEAQELPYLQAVVKESLRLHPAVGISLPRLVPEGGATLAGHYFPAGATVGINPWVIHRNPEAFGIDAAEFRPERWLESKERYNEMEKYFLAFGGGSRVCLGKNISMLEITKIVPELLTRFDLELEDKEHDWKLKNFLFVYQDYKISAREREVV